MILDFGGPIARAHEVGNRESKSRIKNQESRITNGLMIDCIAGYHLNPWTCGIAKFNAILARRLDVPVMGIREVDLGSFHRPLLSIKLSEFTPADAANVEAWTEANAGRFELFLHGFDGTDREHRLVSAAGRVFCVNRELVHFLTAARPEPVE